MQEKTLFGAAACPADSNIALVSCLYLAVTVGMSAQDLKGSALHLWNLCPLSEEMMDVKGSGVNVARLLHLIFYGRFIDRVNLTCVLYSVCVYCGIEKQLTQARCTIRRQLSASLRMLL